MADSIREALRIARERHFNPRKKAKQFSKGTFTATQTGARQEAERQANEQAGIQNARDVGAAAESTGTWEDFISGKGSR